MRVRAISIATLCVCIAVFALAYTRYSQAIQLQAALFTCPNDPRLCNKAAALTGDSLDAGAAHVYEYLSSEGGFTDIRPAPFTGTTTPRYADVDPLLTTGLTGGTSLDGFQMVPCPQAECGLYEDYDSAILVSVEDSFEPVVHRWQVEPAQLIWQGLSLRLRGREVQHILVVPGGKEAVDEAGGLAQRPFLLDRALQDPGNILWQKELDYLIDCTVSGCDKTYEFVNSE